MRSSDTTSRPRSAAISSWFDVMSADVAGLNRAAVAGLFVEERDGRSGQHLTRLIDDGPGHAARNRLCEENGGARREREQGEDEQAAGYDEHCTSTRITRFLANCTVK